MSEPKALETIISHLIDLKEGQKKLHVDQRDLEIKMKEIRADVSMTRVTIEHDIAKKVNILFDAREVQSDVNERILAALERIEAKLTTHDFNLVQLQKTRRMKTKVE